MSLKYYHRSGDKTRVDMSKSFSFGPNEAAIIISSADKSPCLLREGRFVDRFFLVIAVRKQRGKKVFFSLANFLRFFKFLTKITKNCLS